MRTRWRAFGTLAFAITVAWSSGIREIAAANEVDLSSSQGLAETFRSQLGFRADLAWVEAVAAAPDDVTWGVPLTASESDELARRMQIWQHVDSLAFLETKSWFAGIWIDQLQGGEVVVETAGVPDIDPSLLQRLLPVSSSIRFQGAQFTLSELQAAQAALGDARDSQRPGAADIQSVGVDVRANRLSVGIYPFTDASVAAIKASFPTDMIEVVPQTPIQTTSCSSRTNCANPLKGGIEVYSPQGPTCTSGFMGRPIAGSPATTYIVTAGHCISHAIAGANWNHNQAYIGTSYAHWFTSGSHADVGIIQVSVQQNPANLFVANNTSDIRSVSGYIVNNNQVVGSLICRAGFVHYNATCAQITKVNTDAWLDNGTTHIYGLWIMAAASAQGDSGGPVYSGTGAAGIISASDNVSTWYSTIGNVMDVSSFRVCYYSTYPC